MSDYIDRRAALDGLNEQIAYCDKALGSFEISMKDEYAVKVERASLIAYKCQLESIPAADVVPVVRCKDCKFRENDDFCTGRGFPYQLVPDDGFCDKGKRTEE
jgi:hypothetical protein